MAVHMKRWSDAAGGVRGQRGGNAWGHLRRKSGCSFSVVHLKGGYSRVLVVPVTVWKELNGCSRTGWTGYAEEGESLWMSFCWVSGWHVCDV